MAVFGIAVSTYTSRAVYDSATQMTRIIEQVRVEDVNKGSISVDKLQSGDIIVSITVGGKKTDIYV